MKYLSLLALLFSSTAMAQTKAIMEGVASTRYAVKVDTVNGRVDIATTSYTGAVPNVGLHVASNVVVDTLATKDACVLYATGSLSCLSFRAAGVLIASETNTYTSSKTLASGLLVSGGTGPSNPAVPVIVSSDAVYSNGNEAQLRVTGQTNTNQRLNIGYDTTSDFGWIQPTKFGTAYKNLIFVPSGGNTGFGTLNPCTTCMAHVAGNASVNGAFSVGQNTFTVTAAGVVSAPSQPGAFCQIKSASVLANAVETRLYWVINSLNGYNNGGVISFANSSGTFTANGAGVYLFCAYVRLPSAVGEKSLNLYTQAGRLGLGDLTPGNAYGMVGTCSTPYLADGATAWVTVIQYSLGNDTIYDAPESQAIFQKLW